MAETKFPKRRAFAMQKPRKTERTESPRRTERQRAADKRRREEARAMGGYEKGPKTPEKRMTALKPGQVRITGLIVDELTRALGVIRCRPPVRRALPRSRRLRASTASRHCRPRPSAARKAP